ncbi:MAG: hypothetical protein ACRD0L_04155, partial [Acidimicrobiales bacterium]
RRAAGSAGPPGAPGRREPWAARPAGHGLLDSRDAGPWERVLGEAVAVRGRANRAGRPDRIRPEGRR